MTAKRFDIKKFSSDVTAYRKEKKLSRQKVMDSIGGSGRHILLEIENNDRWPTVEVAYNLCDLMGRSLDDYIKST